MDYQEFIEKYHIEIDKNQQKAVTTQKGPVLVLSVPGSGKTTTIVAHIGYLIYCRNVSPSSILILAYNKSAQLDLKSRVAQKYGIQLSNLITIRTVHAFCYGVVQKVFGKTEIIEEWEKRKILRAHYLEEKGEYPLDGEIRNIEAFIEYVKSSMMSEKRIKEYVSDSKEDLSIEYSCYLNYQEEIRKLGKRDFNDLEIITCNLFIKKKEVLTYYQNIYAYICVDEAQDISMIQHKIIDLLAKNGDQNLFMVGDEDQSIYGFRAAYPQALLSFPDRYENTNRIIMNKNYRSIPSIIKGANRLIKHNEHHVEKKMISNQKSKESIHFRKMKSRITQYEWLSDYLITETTADPNKLIAVLYRDNDSVLPLVDLLDRKQALFTINRRVNIQDQSGNFNSRLMIDIEKVLKLSRYLNTEEGSKLFIDLCYKFDLHISKDKLENTSKYVTKCLNHGTDTNILEVLMHQKGMSKRNIQILNTLENYLIMLPQLDAKEAIRGLFNNLKFNESSFDEESWKLKRDILFALGKQVSNLEELIERIKELSTIQANASQVKSSIFLTTIHSSKGLEFDEVVIMDMVDPLFPKYNIEATQREINEQIEEERNLAYVAITRAKSKLTILEYKDKYSTFVKEIKGNKE